MELDQFYTSQECANNCYNLVKDIGTNQTIWLEPSAGTGAFYSLLPEPKLGYDLEPKCEGVIEANFFDLDLDLLIGQEVITVGNPPFGKNSSMAVQFFNKCASVSRVVAMIVPRTFRKPSVVNRLDPYFEKIEDITLPKDSFIADGKPYDVPCCFQIWERRDDKRPKIVTPVTHEDFVFCKRTEGDFAFQRVGGAAGKVKDISDSFKDPSHYFIKANKAGVREVMESLNFKGVKYETAGNPSISKGDLINLYVEAISSSFQEHN